MNFECVVPAVLRLRSGQVRRLAGRPGFRLLILLCGAVLPVSAGARSKPSYSLVSRTDGARRDRVGSDRLYISALAAANRFLQAWQNQDHETGLLMLTDAAKQHSSEESMESFFSSGADAAYEIARGKKMMGGRYAFPVTLFLFHSGTSKPHQPQKSEIVVVRTGKDEWAIDRLP